MLSPFKLEDSSQFIDMFFWVGVFLERLHTHLGGRGKIMTNDDLLLMFEKLRKHTHTFDEVQDHAHCIDDKVLRRLYCRDVGNISEEDLYELAFHTIKLLQVLDYWKITKGAYVQPSLDDLDTLKDTDPQV